MREFNRLKTAFLVRAALLLLIAAASVVGAAAQRVVDKTVATVSDGVRTELITYSDLLWQIALQPGSSVTAPTSQELNAALQVLINQRVFALEAERLPRNAPTADEIAAEINRMLSYFPPGEFEKRLVQVGFKSVKDDNFERIIGQRIAIDKYLDFRFRSFIVITTEDEAKYFRDVFVPEFRRRNPESLLPTLDESRPAVRAALQEQRVSASIDTFLEDAKRRVEIVILSEV
ncbi:MAG: hypothetical protein ACR2IH_01420 [Pyrinomonadaceae bacterium]